MSKLIKTVDPYPINIVDVQGSYLIDDKGNSYLDFWGDEGVNSLGGNICKYCFEVVHIPKMYGDPIKEELASELIRISGMYGKVFFNNSGTEANETAIKLARLYWFKRAQPYRYNIAVMEGNFHGRTGFSLAASDSSDSEYHKLGFGPMPVGFYHFSSIEELYRLSKLPGGLAAVMMAPILGNNCIKLYSGQFFEELRMFRGDTGTLIIFDEIQVGMGRTGKYMAFHNFNIRPDILTLGKGLGAGFPLSATIARESIAEVMTPGTHFNTFGGNSVACKMGLRVVKYLDNNLGDIYLRGNLMFKLLMDLSFVKEVFGMGLHRAFQIDFKKTGYTGFDFCKRAVREGLLICTHRKLGQIRFTPPLTISSELIRMACDRLKATHHSLENSGSV
ncbi:MAG: aspartate aminotransferase family protein [Candidatus Kariarchaeaceae archaeon]|jgi:acetylornithine/succinyldiaminopimelate/putrescine aminotransferase